MGYLPGPFQEFQGRFPEINSAYEELSARCHNAGPLDDRTRRLVKLGIAIGAESQGAVQSHTRKALDAGIGTDELWHVLLLSLTTAGFPQMIAAMRWMDEVIEARAAPEG